LNAFINILLTSDKRDMKSLVMSLLRSASKVQHHFPLTFKQVKIVHASDVSLILQTRLKKNMIVAFICTYAFSPLTFEAVGNHWPSKFCVHTSLRDFVDLNYRCNLQVTFKKLCIVLLLL